MALPNNLEKAPAFWADSRVFGQSWERAVLHSPADLAESVGLPSSGGSVTWPTSSPLTHDDISQDMRRLFRKWRLICLLRQECLKHIGKQGDGFVEMGKAMYVTKGAFAALALKRVWRSILWSQTRKTKELHEFHSLLELGIKEGLIDETSRAGDGARIIKTSLKGDDFCSFSDFSEAFLSKYNNTLTRIVLPTLGIIASFVVGIWSTHLWPLVLKAIAQH